MRRFFTKYTCLFLYTILSVTFSQDSSVTDDSVKGAIEKKGTVLIARDSTEFKDALAQQAKNLLERQNLTVDLIGIKELKKKKSVDYDAIIIINEVRAWRLNRNTTTFLDALDPKERKKVIMVSTAKGVDWKSSQPDIDAVTVASEMSAVAQQAEDIFKDIIVLLGLD